jgi:hypothetical protein
MISITLKRMDTAPPLALPHEILRKRCRPFYTRNRQFGKLHNEGSRGNRMKIAFCRNNACKDSGQKVAGFPPARE